MGIPKGMMVTRIEHFNAAHKLWNPAWSPEKNKEVFGKCANEHFHGHNYELHVTVCGNISDETGFVINARRLSQIIRDKIIQEADHKNLNMDVAFMQGKFTSAEHFARAIWDELASDIQAEGASLYRIKLVETPHIYVEYYGTEIS